MTRDVREAASEYSGDAARQEAFAAGAAWFSDNQWTRVEDGHPEDGMFLTLLVPMPGMGSGWMVEFAPWVDSCYCGAERMRVYFGKLRVVAWMAVPAFPGGDFPTNCFLK